MAGMLRISKEQEERHIWPVHVPGWLALGWRVAGAEARSAGAMPAELLETISPPAATERRAVEEANSSSSGGRRGRRRRDHGDPAEQTLPVAVEPEATEVSPLVAGQRGDQCSVDTEPEPEPELVLSALPVDLLDELRT